MLRTNSKAAKENIRKYILDNFNPENYEPNFWQDVEKNRKNITIPLDRFSVAAHFIYLCFYNEKVKHDKRRLSNYELFKEWCQGLPSVLDTCYYYNRSAVEDLGNILEQTEEERSRYTEQDAEERLTYLIYREIEKATNRW